MLKGSPNNNIAGVNLKSWWQTEFMDIDFNDNRLNERFIRLIDSLSEYPMSPINQACENQAGAKAAYRFFANPKTGPQEILKIHQNQSLQRVANQKVAYVIQDTCFIDYTSHLKTQGLGKLSCFNRTQNKGKGLVMHTCLLLNESGLPIGILDQKIWDRPLEPRYQRQERLYRTRIEEKESYRWLECVDKCAEMFKGKSVNSIVHIVDREGDIFEFMERCAKNGCQFIVRGDLHPRAIIKDGQKIHHRCGRAIFTTQDAFNETALKGELWVEVPRRPSHTNLVGTPTRVAEVEILSCHVKLPPPLHLLSLRRRNDQSKSRYQQAMESYIEANVIWVKEKYPTEGVEPLEWVLYTNQKIESVEDAANVIETYKLRWRIELLHKILKSGCGIEQCRLADAERLKKCITIYSIISWRILWMTIQHRQNPKASCASVLTENEWKALYCRINKTSIPCKKPPGLHEAIHWIARLGGFLDRKSDGEPGMITIWRGWQRLSDITEDWKLFHRNKSCG